MLSLLYFCFYCSLSWSYKTSESSGTATPIVINNQVTSDQSGMFSLSGTYNLVIKSVSPDKSGNLISCILCLF